MDYVLLKTEQRAHMLRERIIGLEADHYGHQMNLDGLVDQPKSADKTKAVEFAQKSQEVIEQAHTAALAELLSLDPEALEPAQETPPEGDPAPE